MIPYRPCGDPEYCIVKQEDLNNLVTKINQLSEALRDVIEYPACDYILVDALRKARVALGEQQ